MLRGLHKSEEYLQGRN